MNIFSLSMFAMLPALLGEASATNTPDWIFWLRDLGSLALVAYIVIWFTRDAHPSQKAHEAALQQRLLDGVGDINKTFLTELAAWREEITESRREFTKEITESRHDFLKENAAMRHTMMRVRICPHDEEEDPLPPAKVKSVEPEEFDTGGGFVGKKHFH